MNVSSMISVVDVSKTAITTIIIIMNLLRRI